MTPRLQAGDTIRSTTSRSYTVGSAIRRTFPFGTTAEFRVQGERIESDSSSSFSSTGTPGAKVEKLSRPARPSDFDGRPLQTPAVPVQLWEATLPAGETSLVLHYAGPLDHPVRTVAEEQARGFAETPGTIGEDGVFLTGAAFWIPWYGGGPFPCQSTEQCSDEREAERREHGFLAMRVERAE